MIDLRGSHPNEHLGWLPETYAFKLFFFCQLLTSPTQTSYGKYTCEVDGRSSTLPYWPKNIFGMKLLKRLNFLLQSFLLVQTVVLNLRPQSLSEPGSYHEGPENLPVDEALSLFWINMSYTYIYYLFIKRTWMLLWLIKHRTFQTCSWIPSNFSLYSFSISRYESTTTIKR